jgi:hypothetical protein
MLLILRQVMIRGTCVYLIQMIELSVIFAIGTYLLLALSGHQATSRECPLSKVKRTPGCGLKP